MTFNPSSAGPIRSASIVLTSAQLLNLVAAPVTVLPAAGPGLAYVPTAAIFDYIAGATPYTDHGSSIVVGVNTLGFLSKTTVGWWDQATSQIIGIMNGGGATGPQPVTSWANNPIVVSATVAPPTGGNGTVALTVLYTIIPAS